MHQLIMLESFKIYTLFIRKQKLYNYLRIFSSSKLYYYFEVTSK